MSPHTTALAAETVGRDAVTRPAAGTGHRGLADLPVPRGAKRVLTMSTIAFTLMFAVWLMFGILGVPIQKEFGLTDPELAWITAVAVLNGSIWRLPAGMLTDRICGSVITVAMLLLTAIPC